jgi:predicted lipoprotein
MRKGLVPVAVVLAVAVVVFLSGLAVGSTGVAGVRPATLTGDGYVGEHVATLWSGDTAYGLSSSVAWRDAAGSEHEDGWPACLALGEVKGVRFTGAVVWHDTGGQATVFWVDCSGR